MEMLIKLDKKIKLVKVVGVANKRIYKDYRDEKFIANTLILYSATAIKKLGGNYE